MTTLEKIADLTWFDLINKLKRLFLQIDTESLDDAPEDGLQYTRQDGEWTEVVSGGGIEALTGDFVDNTDPLNPVLDRGYKVYSALVSQVGTAAPTAIVLENTIGAVNFTYEDVGVYRINSVGLFTEDKTFVFNQQTRVSDPLTALGIIVISDSVIEITSGNSAVSNDIMDKNSIEIRVYN